MADTEHIAVADVSDETAGTGRPGTRVRLPVVELLTGRGFVTGKSGSGKSNTASVVAENLLDNGFGLLIVDVDGEYYGLKEDYEILHVGGEEECDVQVTPDHAEKLATLALEENVPIILDVSSYLDGDEAEALLTAVSRHLFAKAKMQKQPFLLLVEEVHEYIPENGSVGECGKTLIKIGKRGRKHGLGVCGISQRPADVKKDFITQCDWLVWHRLTWDNDTSVVRRVLDTTYANAVEDLDDGEAFLETDWSGTVRRVQFDRKRTFDAGATPGLDEFERPELKSVSDDLVSELAEISEERKAREDRIEELREELDRRNSRIAELETELRDARDLGRMAEQFVDALLQEVRGTNPGRTERERLREERRRRPSDESRGETDSAASEPTATDTGDTEGDDGSGTEMAFDAFDAFDEMGEEEFADGSNGDSTAATASTSGPSAATTNGQSGPTAADATNERSGFDGADVDESYAEFDDADIDLDDANFDDADTDLDDANFDDAHFDDANFDDELGSVPQSLADGPGEADDRTSPNDGHASAGSGTVATNIEGALERDTNASQRRKRRRLDPDKPAYVRRLVRELRGLDERSRGMLAVYHEQGLATPIGALLQSGGGEDRNTAYAHNRALRKGGFLEHVGRGKYRHRLADVLEERADVDLDASVHASYVDWVIDQVALA